MVLKHKADDLRTTISAVVFSNHDECEEYSVTTVGNTTQGWIAVATGRWITVRCKIFVSRPPYQVDFIVDGVLRDVFVGRKRGMSKKSFNTGVFIREGILGRAELQTSPFTSSILFSSACTGDVRNIELRLSAGNQDDSYEPHDKDDSDNNSQVFEEDDANDSGKYGENVEKDNEDTEDTEDNEVDGNHEGNPRDKYMQRVPTCNEVGDWNNLYCLKYASTCIEPVLYSRISHRRAVVLTQSQVGCFLRKLRQSRSGSAPRAILRFLYRDQGSLRKAGIIPRISQAPMQANASLYACPKALKIPQDSTLLATNRRSHPLKNPAVSGNAGSELVAYNNTQTSNLTAGPKEQTGASSSSGTDAKNMDTKTTPKQQSALHGLYKRAPETEGLDNSVGQPSDINYMEQRPSKLRKKDVEALEVEIATLMKQKEESARLRETARRAKEEFENEIKQQYDALKGRKLELLRLIGEDKVAEAAHLKQRKELEEGSQE